MILRNVTFCYHILRTLLYLIFRFFKCLLVLLKQRITGGPGDTGITDKQGITRFACTYGWEYLKSHIENEINEFYVKIASVGKMAPNPIVYKMDGTACKLLDFAKAGRPLVLSFGSHSCQFFLRPWDAFNQCIIDFEAEVDFLIVYIREAHPKDGWVMPHMTRVVNHKAIEDRLDAAKVILDEYDVKCQLVLDSMEDKAVEEYGAFPNRLYIIKDGLVQYGAARGPFGYKIQELRKELRRCIITCKIE